MTKLPSVRHLRQLLHHAEERQRIYLKREAGEPWPWTSDPIFQQFRFCNTYRQNDRVTKWWTEHWAKPYADHDNLWFAAAMLRQINWPDTLEEIGFPQPWDPRHALKIMNHRREQKQKVTTSAYLVCGGIPAGRPLNEHLVKYNLDPLWKAVSKCESVLPWETGLYNVTLQQTWKWLMTFHGFGAFIAYEVVTDLRHTRYLCNAPDIMTWANPGPGAKRGLNRLYEREVNATVPKDQLLEELLRVNDWIAQNRMTDLLPTWEPRDTEHLACEVDKAQRARDRLAAGKTVGLERFRPPGLFPEPVE